MQDPSRKYRSVDELNALTAPVEHGDWFKLPDGIWQARQGYIGTGWTLVRDALGAGDRTVHQRVRDIRDQVTLIREIVAAAQPPAIPENYKPSGEPYYSRTGDKVQAYAKFPIGSAVKIASGQVGEVVGHIGQGPVITRLLVRFDSGIETGVNEQELSAVEATTPEPGAIENFGEALPPARRALAAKLDQALTDADITNRPLSEIWPLAENEAIEDPFAAAVAHAARAEVPAKPRQPFKLKRWVEKVKAVRELATKVLDGRLTRERIQQDVDGPRPGLKDWWAKVQLLERLPRDQWKRIGAVEERPDGLVWVAESKAWVKRPQLRISVDDKAHFLEGDAPGVDNAARLNDGARVYGTVAGNMDGIRALLDGQAQDKGMQFEIRGSGARYFINKKGDPEYRHLMDFTSVEDARKALTEQRDSLVAAWQAVKDRDNITERDLRSAENRPRAGKDHRNGRDVTPQDFMEQFGFRGGEFGKWVQQGKGDKDRQTFLNSAYDALMDLADLVGIPPRAISLNGTLGLAFGSRGNGWASAHFEPSNLVINLTKTRGAGALAHEWFHALDNYFSRLRRDGKEVPFTGKKAQYNTDNFITHQPEALMVRKDSNQRFQPMTAGQLRARWEATKHLHDNYNPEKWQRDPANTADVRPEVEERFVALVEALNKSPMSKRSALLDKGGRGYWSSTLERAARAFESHILARMHEQGYHNDFLANVVPAKSMGMNPDRYPYLLPGEVAPIADAFDALFNTVQTKEGADGKVALFAKAPNRPPELSDDAAVDRLVQAWEAIAAKEDAFKLPRVEDKEIRKIASRIMTDTVTITDRKDGGYDFKFDDGTPANLIPHPAIDDGYYLNASKLDESGKGTFLYQAVLTWAHNNGVQLVPDPGGLTEINQWRRTEQMLSSALRFGTTRHMRPARMEWVAWPRGNPMKRIGWRYNTEAEAREAAMAAGVTDPYITDLNEDSSQWMEDWIDVPKTPEEDRHNLRILIMQSYANTAAYLPPESKLWYDLDALEVRDSEGRSGDEAIALGRTHAAAKRGIGGSTLARGLLARSVLRGTRGQVWDGLLARLLSPVAGTPRAGSKPIAYARGAAKPGLSKERLAQVLGKARASAESKGLTVLFVANGAELTRVAPEITSQSDYDDTVQAAISADRRTVYFVADRIGSAVEAQRLWAHEMVGHYSMEDMLQPRLFRELRDAILRLREAGKWPEVFAEVSRRYERNADGTYRALDDATFAAETIAVFAERNIQTSILQRAINGVRAWLRSMGFDLQLSQGELRQLLWEAGQKLEGRAYRSSAEAILGKPAPKTPQEGMERYSFAKGSEPQVVDRLESLSPTSLMQSIKDKVTDLQQVGLGALQLRHLGEIGEKFMPPVAKYADTVQRMQTTRNVLQQASVDIVEKSQEYQKKHADEAPKTFRLLHEATLAGVDPSKAHQPLLMRSEDSRTNQPITLKAKNAFVRKMQELAKLSPGDANAFMERARQVKKMWAQEKKRAASHAELLTRFEALSPEAKALWNEIRETYAKQSAMYEKALKDRIESLATDGMQRSKMLTEMRLNFEANRVPFYVPLSRWGDYFVAATAPDGQREFHMQETAAEQRRVRAELVKAGYTKVASGVKTQMSKQLDGASADFVAKIDKLLVDSKAPERVRDDVYQLYLQSLPEMSMRKNFIHRKGVRGYSEDAVRALASNVFHASYQIARLRYSHRLDRHVQDADAQATRLADEGSPDANLAGRLVRELRDRHEWILNPKDSAAAQKLTTVGFLWYLAVSPAAAAINLLQTAMVSLPVMAARYGWGTASSELWRAFTQSARTLGHMEKLDLTADERRAHAEFEKRGTFDKSQVHNLAGLSETDTASYDPRLHKALSWSSALFHGAEVVNRESTSMASYRMARAAGKSHEAAIEEADRYVNQTHLDYSNSNRSRYMRSAPAKVLLQFKQYSMGMTWLLGRAAWQSLRDSDPTTRAENRRALAGILGMTAMFSGTMGLPMMGVIAGVLNAVAAAFGDDDEPWEFDAEWRALWRGMLGDKGAEYVLRGPVQAIFGIGIAARTGLSELWLRSPDNELEGRALAQYYLEQAAGPVVGGMFVNALRGYQLMQDGHVWRGFETILPKFIKDGMKSVRYIDEGVNTLRGDAVIDDLSVSETIMQVLGISPARIGNTYDVQNDVTAYADHIENRRRYLMDAYALALRMGDTDAQQQVLAKMRTFSSKYPEKAITGDSIRRSIMQRQRYSKQAVSGVVVDPALRQRVERELGMN